ncbi:hypothetical protein C8R43DRAFT_845138, partial [Mycena crocata]
ASIPPIRLALDAANRRTAIRFNKLSVNNPVVQRLPDEWRDGQAPSVPPPLPVRVAASRNKLEMRKSTQLDQLSKLTSAKNERIFPYLTAPWRRTTASYAGRMQVSGSGGVKKEDAAEAHKQKISNILMLPDEHLLVYTDGSLRPVHRVRRVG